MCGICGVIQVTGPPRRVLGDHQLDAMTDAMAHRGPDDRGTYCEDGIAIGARRLSVVDVSGGHQPFSNETGAIWAVQNGELYNHELLRRDLQGDGHSFASRCDTEVLPHLYERDGERFPERLRGMFAVCVWDGRRRRAVLARDRLGIKPLYVARVGDLLVFGSELKSVLASGLVPLDLDLDAIDAFMALGYVPAPLTPIAAVRKLMPGHRLVVEDGAVRDEPYWEHPHARPDESLGFEESAARVLEALEESVRMRLMADVPLGSMLSGGLDSSLITALMARHMTEPLKTFSVGFREAGAANELGAARRMAESVGAEHHELELSVADLDVSPADLVWHLDEPLADLSALGFLALSRLAAREVTVALSGQGADELFAGYRRHRVAAVAERWWSMPAPVRRAVAGAAAAGPARLRRGMRRLAEAGDAASLMAAQRRFDAAGRAGLLGPELRELRAAERVVAERLNGDRSGQLAATLYLDARLGLPDDMLHYFDRTSMAYSLEVRVPFLDHELVELAATIPARHKLRRGEGKALVRHAARGLVPDEIIDRPKVGFFNPVMGMWLQAQMDGAVADHLLAGDARYPELLDRAAVHRLVADHRDRPTATTADLLLRVLVLEIWLASFLPRAAAAAVPAAAAG